MASYAISYGHADHTGAEATSTKAGAITVVGFALKLYSAQS